MIAIETAIYTSKLIVRHDIEMLLKAHMPKYCNEKTNYVLQKIDAESQITKIPWYALTM